MRRAVALAALCVLAACGHGGHPQTVRTTLGSWGKQIVWPTTTTTSVPLPSVTLPSPPVVRKSTVGHRGTPRPLRSTGSAESGRCGGDLPPCWVMNRESGGNPNAYNPTGCGGRGCYGKWQCDPHSCNGTGTEAQQDAAAAALWDHGRGCSHWAAC